MNPPIPTTADAMSGRVTVEINEVSIPSFMLGEITLNLEEGTRTSTRLSGTINKPSGSFDTSEISIVYYPNQWQDLAHFFPELYNAPSGSQSFGNIILGGGTCSTKVPVPVNLHQECEGTDDRDVFFPAALARITLDSTFNETDDLAVTITLMAQPSTTGIARLGTGDLTQPSIYDAATNTTVPVSS